MTNELTKMLNDCIESLSANLEVVKSKKLVVSNRVPVYFPSTFTTVSEKDGLFSISNNYMEPQTWDAETAGLIASRIVNGHNERPQTMYLHSYYELLEVWITNQIASTKELLS